MAQDATSLTDVACPLCARQTRPWLTVPRNASRHGSGEPYQLYWCDGCAYGQLWPRPSPEEVSAAYDDPSYYTHRAPAAKSDHSFLDRVRIRLAWSRDYGSQALRDCDAVRRLPAGSLILDVGCGNCTFMDQMHDRGMRVVGVEPDRAARQRAEARGHRIVEGTAEHLPSEITHAEGYDLVVLSHVLEHCVEPEHAITNIVGLLAPHGKVVVEVPNNEAAGLQASGEFWRWLDVPRHINFFSSRSLQTLCRRAGLSVSAIEWSGYTRQFGPRWIQTELAARSECGLTANLPTANGRAAAWRLLLRTAFAPSSRKYDSVRVVASIA